MDGERLQGILIVLIILFVLLAISLGDENGIPPEDSDFKDSDY